jgi:hypothetical protein
MDSLFSVEAFSALATLSLMEIVLGIDNIIFIAILTGRLPKEQQPFAQKLGLSAALITRLLLLFSLSWLMGLTEPLFTLLSHGFSLRDIILISGGLFLVGKATFEIHHKIEGEGDEGRAAAKSSHAKKFFHDYFSDHASRYCLFIGLGHHRYWDGATDLHYGHRHGDSDVCHAFLSKLHQWLCGQTSHCENSSSLIFDLDRCGPAC